MEANQKHIKNQGLHNLDLELNEFIKNLEKTKNSDNNIVMDFSLSSIVNNQKKIRDERK